MAGHVDVYVDVRQLLIDGDGPSLEALAGAIESAKPVEDLELRPTNGSIVSATSLVVKDTKGLVCISVAGSQLVVAGSREKRAVLAHNIRLLAEGRWGGPATGAHSHEEWYPGNPIFEEESLPLVVGLR